MEVKKGLRVVAYIIIPTPRPSEIIGKLLRTFSLELEYQGLGKERDRKDSGLINIR